MEGEGEPVIRAIVWKELREQGLIGLTLIVLGSGILVAAATLAEPATQGATPADVVRFLGAGLLAALLLSVTAGTVCGGALFAAERESGTMGFLESLPVSRWQLWKAKIAAGTILMAIEVGFVLVVAAGLGIVDSIGWAVAIAAYSLLAFVWGLFGSTHANTTLGSVGVALPAGAFASILFYLPIGLFYHNPRTNMPQMEGALLFLGLMFAAPLIGSAFRFTRKDRDRAAHDTTAIYSKPGELSGESDTLAVEAKPSSRSRLGIRALLWLGLRQLLKPGLAIAAFAVVLGFTLLLENIQPVMVWPALALTAGVLAGVTAFVDEQSSGIARYWGERRLPIGRLWFVKLAIHAAFAGFLVVLMLLPAAIRTEATFAQTLRGGSFLSHTFRTLIFDGSHLGSQGWKFVFLPLAYGFAAGHLCGLLFRKAVVAAGVAGLVGGTMAAFWLPSLFSGGVLHWQIWLPPIAMLVTARLLFRAWASERLATRRPLIALSSGIAAMLLILAGGLGYRVFEVPNDPTSEDDIAYIASLPPLEANDSGRQFRTAAERFARISQAVPAFPKRAETPPGTLEERVSNIPYHGWNADDFEAQDWWMQRIYALDISVGLQDETWFEQARQAGQEKEVGIFEHPLRTGASSSLLTQANGKRMGMILLAHGLQKQAAGDPAQFPADLQSALALGRSFRNGSIVKSLNFGNEVARACLSATDHWLAALEGRPDLLRQVLALLREDDPVEAFDPRPHVLAERYIMRDMAKAPGQFLPAQLTPPGTNPEQTTPLVDLIGVAWSVPWERERTRRLLGVGFETGNPTRANRLLVQGRPGTSVFLTRKQSPDEMIDNDRQVRLHRRAALIALAIRLHQVEKRSTPATLDDLVAAGYLPAVPLDPYSSLPFNYRVSEGETLSPPALPLPLPPGTPTAKTSASQEPRPIAPGQPILWSVGPNRTNEGGRNSPTRPGMTRGGDDIVFLVPTEPAKP